MKDIPGYEEKYAITEDGQVWSYYLNDFKKQRKNNRGYYYVNLKNQNGQKSIAVHRLVALTYIPNPNNYPEVNHKDENKTNNCVDNLEWCTHEYNIHYGTARERATKTQQQYNVNQKAVLCIETGLVYHSTQEASRQTGVNNTGISKVCNGRRLTAGGYHWKFVNPDEYENII